MRKLLRIAAILIVMAGFLAWFLLGHHTGWTKTTVTEWQHDAVTGLDGPVIRQRFVPGVDWLAATGLVAVGCLAVSFVRRPGGAR